MPDRELTSTERIGTFIQHRNTGERHQIRQKDIGGYLTHCIDCNYGKFIPWKDLNKYVVIE